MSEDYVIFEYFYNPEMMILFIKHSFDEAWALMLGVPAGLVKTIIKELTPSF